DPPPPGCRTGRDAICQDREPSAISSALVPALRSGNERQRYAGVALTDHSGQCRRRDGHSTTRRRPASRPAYPRAVDERPDHLTHVDDAGAARMVDVSDKDISIRRAIAAGSVRTRPEVISLLARDALPKGDHF